MGKKTARSAFTTVRLAKFVAGASALATVGGILQSGTASAYDVSETSTGCVWEWPVDGPLSQGFHTGHDGADFAVGVGTVLRAPTSGTISVAGPNDPGGYGTYIQLEADTGERIQMGHLSQTWVSVGARVDVGDAIGATGNTGSSTGPHLHLRIHRGGPVDPVNFLRSVGACDTGSGDIQS